MAASDSLTTCSRTPDRVGSLSCELINELLGAISEGLARVFSLSWLFNAAGSLVRGVFERSLFPSKYSGTSIDDVAYNIYLLVNSVWPTVFGLEGITRGWQKLHPPHQTSDFSHAYCTIAS